MSKPKPNPGHGYIVRELLGQGRWKEVYRAVVRGEWSDRALARFIHKPDASDLFNEIKPLLPPRKPAALENVARLYHAFKGDDGDIYIEEELLYRPLQSLAPLKMVDQFFRIARDLCIGLSSLHRMKMVHRDLKLDNCGIDHVGVAKIFDLGSVTSEGGKVKGTTLSRAPELFAPNAKCTRACDVWAMGAVLFALRTGGDYPFVTREEARNRPLDGAARRRFDRMVSERVSAPGAAAKLQNRIKDEFPNGSGALMEAMLHFNPKKRLTASKSAILWRGLLNPWLPADTVLEMAEIGVLESEYRDILAYLNAVLDESTDMSSLQWNRVGKWIDKLEKSQLDKSKLKQLQDQREKVAEKRALEIA